MLAAAEPRACLAAKGAEEGAREELPEGGGKRAAPSGSGGRRAGATSAWPPAEPGQAQVKQRGAFVSGRSQPTQSVMTSFFRADQGAGV